MSRLIQGTHRAVVILLLCVLLLAALTILYAVAHDQLLHQPFSGSNGLVSQGIAQIAGETQSILHQHLKALLGALLLITLASAFLLWAEVQTVVARSPKLILSRSEIGVVSISLDQVGLLAQREAEHVDGVREVRTFTATHKGGLQVKQTVAVEPDRQLPLLAEQIQLRVKKSLEYHLGFPVSGVAVTLQRAAMSKSLL